MNAARLLWFELSTATPRSVAALARSLSGAELRKTLWGYTRRSLGDPFAALGPPADAPDRFTRRQLKPVLALHDALRLDAGLDPERTRALLLDIVAGGGAEFLRMNLDLPTLDHWLGLDEPARRSLANALLARFPNAQSTLTRADADGLSFEVSACHFARLAGRLDRAELAALFCEADARFFGDPAVGIALERPHTLARGGPSCAFHLRFTKTNSD